MEACSIRWICEGPWLPFVKQIKFVSHEGRVGDDTLYQQSALGEKERSPAHKA